jgi:branched-chain amino acid transport system substrate-binding protein
MRSALLPLLLLSLSALTGCGIDYEDVAKRRGEYARLGKGDIVVAAIAEPWAANYVNGIQLAAQQINERPGKLLGRKVNVRVMPSPGTNFHDVQGTVLKLAKDPRVSAVLGHRRSEIAIPASVVYEASKVIFMPPFATAKGLTALNFKFVFRMLPNSSVMADQIASVAELLGHKDIVLLYTQDEHNRELAFMFEDAAIKRGMGFVHRRSFNADEQDYRELITQFVNKPNDMIFLAAGTVAGARMVQQLREMGVKSPIMGGESLNARSFADAAGPAGDNTIVPILYRTKAGSQTNRGFVSEYQQAYGVEPDQGAAQGYDSLRLLADAISQAKSTVPSLISSTLHYLPFWAGVTGVHSFDAQGDVTGKKYFFQVLRDGKWHFLPGVHMPYFLERFDRFVKSQPARKGVVPTFAKPFSNNLHPDDLRSLQLDFLHEILQFQQLGVVYGEQIPGVLPDSVERMVALGEKRGFGVESCGVAFSQADKKQIERQLLNCYGKLAIKVNALNVTGFKGVDKDLVVRLQRPLKEYKIPVLALLGDADFDEGMSIRMGKFGEKQNIKTDYYVNLFGGILHDTKVYELAEKLENLPLLGVNLKVLNDYGLLHSGSLVGLAPDLYLEWLVSAQ